MCDSKEVEGAKREREREREIQAASIIYISHSQVGFHGGRYLEANQKDKHSKINTSQTLQPESHQKTRIASRLCVCSRARGCVCIQMKHHFECYSLVETGGTLNTYKYFLVMSTRSTDPLYAHIDTAHRVHRMAGTVDDKP